MNLNDEWSVGIVKFATTKINHIEKYVEPKIKFVKVRAQYDENTFFDILKPHTQFFNIINEHFFDRYNDDLVLQAPTYNRWFIEFTIMNIKIAIRMNIEFTPTELFDEMFAQIPKENWQNFKAHLKTLKSSKQNLDNLDAYLRRTEHIQPIETLGIPNYMCFYSDLIKPQIFGNVMTRGMLMHPVKYNKQYETYQNCDIPNIQFFPIEKTHITDMSFLIADEQGNQINFMNDTFYTMIVLEFRKHV
ncbi:MAG TPA: hypothetical protein DDZ41_11495 [Flavobacterium sp.]|nr:hypothetical protein [Flavobacterium sp.]